MEKRGISIAFNITVWFIIGLIVLALSFGAYFILSGKAGGAIEFFKNLVRFRF